MPDETTITLDMHTHLLEKNIKAKDYWNKASEINLAGIAITEHSEIEPGKAYDQLLRERKGSTILIPGMEVLTNKGHVLAYGRDRGIYEVKELIENPVDLMVLVDAAKDNNLILTIPHPWGFDYDSLAYTMGIGPLEELVKREFIGVEIYNGMIGYLANFTYESGWIKRPVNFLDFLEKNRITARTGISEASGLLKRSIDKRRLETVARNVNAIELGEIAKFVTAGSDAHSANRIGTGIMKIKTTENELNAEKLIEEILKKDNVIWSGPLVKETGDGMYERVTEPLTKKEILQGLKYITTKIIQRKVGRKKKEPLTGEGKDAAAKTTTTKEDAASMPPSR